MTSTAPLGYRDLLEGKLISAVTTTTSTGVTVKVKQVNGATPSWPTIAHRVKVIQRTATKTKAEIWDVAAGTTQTGQTVTLGTLTRGLSLADGTSFAAGTGVSFAAGADVFMTWDLKDAAATAKLDLNNTFTGINTFSGAVTTTNFKVPVYADAAARDAAITVPANGMIVYLTDVGVLYQYIGGAWATFASGTTANSSDTVAGKVERATTAEASAGTDTGTTGAPTYVRPSEVTTVANLASTDNGLGASLVGVEDSGSKYTATTVEGVLAELATTPIMVSDTAYDASTWDGVTTVAPSKNAVRDKLESLAYVSTSFATGTFVIGAADTVQTGQNIVYTKKKEIKVGLGGTISVSFQLKSSNGSITVKGRVYVNGVAAGTEQTTASTSYVTFTEDIAVAAGDLVQLYITDTQQNYVVSCQNFRILVATAPSTYVITN